MGGRGATLAGQHTSGNDTVKLPGNGGRTGGEVDPMLEVPETLYKDESYDRLKKIGVSRRRMSDNVDETIVSRQTKQIEKLVDKYHKAYSSATKKGNEIQIDVCQLRTPKGKPVNNIAGIFFRTYGENEGEAPKRKVMVNTHWAERTANQVTVSVASGIKDKHFVPIDINNAREYVITHEMGHALEDSIITKICADRHISYEKYCDKISKQIFDEVWENCQKKNPGKKVEACLSNYAATNNEEWFAETFTNLQLSKNPSPIAKALGEYIERFNK